MLTAGIRSVNSMTKLEEALDYMLTDLKEYTDKLGYNLKWCYTYYHNLKCVEIYLHKEGNYKMYLLTLDIKSLIDEMIKEW